MTVHVPLPAGTRTGAVRLVPAVLGAAGLFKEMPYRRSARSSRRSNSPSKSPPFIDAMTYGFSFRWSPTSGWSAARYPGTVTRRVAYSRTICVRRSTFTTATRRPEHRSTTTTASSSSSRISGPSSCRPGSRCSSPSGQPVRPAVRHDHLDGRRRPLSRQLHRLPGALARSYFTGVLRRARRSTMHSAQAGEWSAQFGTTFGRSIAAAARDRAVAREPGTYRWQFRAPKR